MLVPLDAQDIAEVMRIERLPGYEGFVGTWPAEEHEAERISPDARSLNPGSANMRIPTTAIS